MCSPSLRIVVTSRSTGRANRPARHPDPAGEPRIAWLATALSRRDLKTQASNKRTTSNGKFEFGGCGGRRIGGGGGPARASTRQRRRFRDPARSGAAHSALADRREFSQFSGE